MAIYLFLQLFHFRGLAFLRASRLVVPIPVPLLKGGTSDSAQTTAEFTQILHNYHIRIKNINTRYVLCPKSNSMHLDYMYCSKGPLIKVDSNLEHST
jgi:hypothetical protein